MVWQILLGAALEASLGLLAEAGFGDEVRALKERWTKQTEKARRAAFDRAVEQASEAVDDENLRLLLRYPPFQEEVVTGLLDPTSRFDWQAALADWEGRLPTSYVPALQRFFSALQLALLADDTWGPILERYQAMRFRRDVMEAMEEQALDVSQRRVVSMLNAELQGSGAIAQGEGAVAAGAGGMAIGGNVERAVQVVIQQLTVQQISPHPVGRRPEDLRERYLRELAHEANRLPWTIVEREYAHPEHGEALGLAEVYTALDTTEMKPVEREEELRRFLAQVARDEARRIPAQQMVDQEDRLVVLGDPGSGKSTFVKHLAYTLAQANIAEDPAPWLERMDPWRHGPLLPVRVELRAFAAYVERQDAEGAKLLLGYLRTHLEEWEMEDFWPLLNETIRSRDETLLILFDGLDEAPADLRARVVGAVQDFADRYEQHRYVITCRPYAYVGQPCQLRRFKEVTIAPFDEEQIDHFIETWYRELAQRGRLASQKAKTQARQMREAVRRSGLRQLARRPLLLTVMTLLHTFRGQLPQDRTELYADAVDLLLRRWESRIGDEEGILERLDMPGLKMSDLEAGLYEVAFRAHRGAGETERAADIGEADLRKWLAAYLGEDWNRAGEFVDYIRERAGLLIRHKTEAYTFPHRTFQEFMAACHLVGMKDYPTEAAKLTREEPSRWREVFVLAAGHAARTHRLGQAIGAVNALCPQDAARVVEPDAAAYSRAQLAGEALLEIGLVGVRRQEAGRVVLERIRSWLAGAVRSDAALEPKQRAGAGRTLSELGDARPGVGVDPDTGVPDILWCEVPRGPFVMGDGGQQHRNETITRDYLISRYPITNAQFAAFQEAGGYQEEQYWTEAQQAGVWKEGQVKGRYDDLPREGPYDYGTPFNLRNHPVVGVTWYESLAFCRWLEDRLRTADGRLRVWRDGHVETVSSMAATVTVRLPSEAQWEKAARGTDASRYPWGEERDPNRANYDDSDIGATSAVGCFAGGASPYGVEELSGNVWEWTRSLWGKEALEPRFGYPYDPEDGRENLEAGIDILRVVRGGSFYDTDLNVRCACRFRDVPSYHWDDFGFRVVVAPFSPTSDL